MDLVFLIMALVCAGAGVYLLADFMLWRVRARIVLAQITGFQGRRSRGMKLPVVVFPLPDGGVQTAETARIDRFSHILNRPGEGEPVEVIYRADNPALVRVYGFINVVAGLFLLLPLIFAMGARLEVGRVLAQASFALTFGAIIIGGWALLKLIQRHY